MALFQIESAEGKRATGIISTALLNLYTALDIVASEMSDQEKSRSFRMAIPELMFGGVADAGMRHQAIKKVEAER